MYIIVIEIFFIVLLYSFLSKSHSLRKEYSFNIFIYLHDMTLLYFFVLSINKIFDSECMYVFIDNLYMLLDWKMVVHNDCVHLFSVKIDFVCTSNSILRLIIILEVLDHVYYIFSLHLYKYLNLIKLNHGFIDSTIFKYQVFLISKSIICY